jgi:hypothetical protein
VPGASDGISHQHPLGERTVIMGALGTDREERATGSRQQHGLARGLPQNHAALGKIRERDPSSQVGSVEFRFLFAHRCLRLTRKRVLHLQTRLNQARRDVSKKSLVPVRPAFWLIRTVVGRRGYGQNLTRSCAAPS